MPENRDVEQMLRVALRAEADAVRPAGDGLARIRQRVAARRPWWQTGALWVPAAAAMVAVALVAGFLAGQGWQRGQELTVAGPGPAVTAVGQAAPPPASAQTLAVPVYFLGRGATPWLYREWFAVQRAKVDADRIVAVALHLMVAGRAADPDYQSLWPAATTVTVTSGRDAGADTWWVKVALGGGAGQGAVAGPDLAQASVQQVVYTVTAAMSVVGRPVSGVQVSVGGHDVATLWGQPVRATGALVRDAKAAAPVWVLGPEQGQKLTGPGVTISGAARTAGTAVGWQVSRDGAVVARGSATAGTEAGHPWSAAASLPAGTYTVSVWAGGSPESSVVDDKTFTVR